MVYEIVETLEDGRIYCLVDDDDGARFGQIVDASDCADASEIDGVVLSAVIQARHVRELEVRRARAVDLRSVKGSRRTVVETSGAKA